ncbi:hypothetical protein TNCV_4522081 [Trichonephila clavipes]|nr:hypothetical protein TNCV_4522081 [Trichonephila clavipes]
MSFIRRPGSGLPRQTSRREDHHTIRNARVQPIVSHRPPSRHRLNLSSDDNCFRVWRPRSERLNPSFALQ